MLLFLIIIVYFFSFVIIVFLLLSCEQHVDFVIGSLASALSTTCAGGSVSVGHGRIGVARSTPYGRAQRPQMPMLYVLMCVSMPFYMFLNGFYVKTYFCFTDAIRAAWRDRRTCPCRCEANGLTVSRAR